MARRTTTGLRIDRRFTQPGVDPYSTIEWSRRDSRITNPDGSVVFAMEDAEIPASWSQVAADIMVSKYFRKAGVPRHGRVGESGPRHRRQPRDRAGDLGAPGVRPTRRNLAAVG